MSKQILAILKKKLEDLAVHGEVDAETRRNALKEDLQFYVLNFIYHHPRYNKWIMYGGSALRIMHGLDRMSVDLDFEVSHEITREFLTELKVDIENYFSKTYGTQPHFLTITLETGRGLRLKFNTGELNLGLASQQTHIKIDLNHFTLAKEAIERRPINRDQLSFVIVTYKMSTLMASKIAAIFLRGQRGVGKVFYEEKGRYIYDLLWYMNHQIVPDLDYLAAKDVQEAKDLRTLFDRLTIKMNKVSDENLKQDLLPLFLDRTYVENWLKNWRHSYIQTLEAYKICTVTTLEMVQVHWHFSTDNFSFTYNYRTEEEEIVRIRYIISDYWLDLRDGDLSVPIDPEIRRIIKYTQDGVSSHAPSQDKLAQYATIFYQKTEKYLKKSNRMILGKNIVTKLIRLTADHLNQKEQILLNKSALLCCELEDLLK